MSNPRILITDDDPLLLQLLDLRLRGAGFDVSTALDGLAALNVLGSVDPDVILLDAMMPRMGGFEVLRRLRAQHAHRKIRVLMLTALRHEDDIVSALEQGADDYLVKPFSPDELIARIRRWVPSKAA